MGKLCKGNANVEFLSYKYRTEVQFQSRNNYRKFWEERPYMKRKVFVY